MDTTRDRPQACVLEPDEERKRSSRHSINDEVEPVNNDLTAPERSLWCAVISQAAKDTYKRCPDATSWWGTEDYEHVCHLAGIEPEVLLCFISPGGVIDREACFRLRNSLWGDAVARGKLERGFFKGFEG